MNRKPREIFRTGRGCHVVDTINRAGHIYIFCYIGLYQPESSVPFQMLQIYERARNQAINAYNLMFLPG